MDVRQVFDDLVRFETELWNQVDARLRAECDVTLAAFNVMLAVSQASPCRVNDIATALAITVGGASQAVDRFAAQGIITRQPNPEDRRSSIVVLTGTGWEALERAKPVFDDELQARLVVPVSPGTLDVIATGLAALRTAIEQEPGSPA
jgi:DNA-binding MarR family transcriptional regulator